MDLAIATSHVACVCVCPTTVTVTLRRRTNTNNPGNTAARKRLIQMKPVIRPVQRFHHVHGLNWTCTSSAIASCPPHSEHGLLQPRIQVGHVDAQMNKTTTRRRAHVIATAHAHVFSNRLRANVPVQICVMWRKRYTSSCMVVCA